MIRVYNFLEKAIDAYNSKNEDAFNRHEFLIEHQKEDDKSFFKYLNYFPKVRVQFVFFI